MSPEPVPPPPPPPQCPGCDCGEPFAKRLEKGDEAFRAGEYEMAAELFRSMLAGLAQPDRGLCLRLGDALARARRLPEALGAFRGAARLGALRPEELGELVGSLACALGRREWRLQDGRPGRAPEEPREEQPASAPVAPRDLLGCPRCQRLLHKPVTLPCGLTVCKRCVESGAARPQARRVNVVLNGLLEKCFPAECRVRRLAGQARTLQRQQQPEAALLRSDQALDLAPRDNSLLLLRAELYLTMKNYEQALQDANAVCQNEPLLTKGHHMKAQALSGLGRSKEALKEFLYCLALNPECNSVKKEAQKVMCEVFFPASENTHQNLTSSIQSRILNSRLKAQCASHVNTQPLEEGSGAGGSKNASEKSDVFRNTNSSVLYFILGLHFEEDKEVLESILPVAPSTGLKRQFPDDLEDMHELNGPGKVPKKEADSSPQRNMTSNVGESPELSIDVTDFECALCMRLLFEPVTTPCGHMFCLKCLERCLDHAPHCPLCKEKLSELLASRNFNITILAEELIFQYLSDELSDRKRIYDEEMTELSNLTRDVPIFVCAMAFPTVPCPLHVFEPRYRLMIRRCMETGTKRFGMCLSAEHAGISEYGCMLEIKDVRTFPDGSSVVDAIGISRFKVLSHRHRDGYNTADIEYLEDEKVEGPAYEELTSLHDSVYQQSVSWFTSLQDHMKEQILSHFGLMPDREAEPQSNPSGPAWSWWILAVLPLERKAQLAILGMISLKERLLAIRRILVIITRKMNSRQELVNSRERNN
ncbi:LON peptidase N-terminal domain and RING finger protein 2 [Mustela lutreola]|uniref:LON peptidase N-terminal domain and RING finger protein 2 n=1 Tax=Mustela erminea TaxID=36723 RepID=UPI001386DF91|nr:LON peptidase N-terminal domain and RING finger protein 2 [Mustela erminea]XP_058990501.1 LON peptidase N-terminal domain and RING finger protein 2 [Mustela lutreola]